MALRHKVACFRVSKVQPSSHRANGAPIGNDFTLAVGVLGPSVRPVLANAKRLTQALVQKRWQMPGYRYPRRMLLEVLCFRQSSGQLSSIGRSGKRQRHRQAALLLAAFFLQRSCDRGLWIQPKTIWMLECYADELGGILGSQFTHDLIAV